MIIDVHAKVSAAPAAGEVDALASSSEGRDFVSFCCLLGEPTTEEFLGDLRSA